MKHITMKPKRSHEDFMVLRNISNESSPTNFTGENSLQTGNLLLTSGRETQTLVTDKTGHHQMNGLDKNLFDLYLPHTNDKGTPEARKSSCSEPLKDNLSCSPPLVVFVHGGGWRRGDRHLWRQYLSSYDTNLLLSIMFYFSNLYQNVGESFARNGIACAVISYPLLQPTLLATLFELLTSFCMSTLLSTTLLTLIMFLFQFVFTWCLPFTNIYIINQIYLKILNSDLRMIHVVPICLMLSQLSIWCIIILNIHTNYKKGTSKYILFSSIPTGAAAFFIWFRITQPTFSSSIWILSILFTITLQTTIAINQIIFIHKSDTINCDDQVRSVARTIQWLKIFGKTTCVYDTDKMVLAGHSAGSHLINQLIWDDSCLKNFQLDRGDIKVSIYLYE